MTLAHESGNQDTADLLAKVVDVIDPATGTIRLKARVADADEMALDTRSTKPVRARKSYQETSTVHPLQAASPLIAAPIRAIGVNRAQDTNPAALRDVAGPGA